jgi:hypothetical protein
MDPFAAALAASPELFPFALDPRSGAVTMLRLSRADYEQASFLDRRLAGLARPSRSLPFTQLASSVEAAHLGESCDFIFHIGHVGSTLLSRLIGRHPRCFSLREPEILRTIALAQPTGAVGQYLPVFLRLWSRTFDPDARAVVKASSFVSDLAAPILARENAPKALVMGVPPETYLATIFGGENAPMEARALAPLRLARLQARLGITRQPQQMSLGEIVALGWACEASALAAAIKEHAGQVHVMNFDNFLAQPYTNLQAALSHFAIAAGEDEIAAILSGPEMLTYSKAPEHSYDSALRRSVLDDGRARHCEDIREGLLWLEQLAKLHPQIEEAMSLFG